MKKKIFTALILMLFVTFTTSSQVVPPPAPPPPPPGLPVDGGLALLLIFGIFYGYRKLKAS